MPTARVLRAYVTTGLLFMLIPGTFLGVLNLIQASAQESVGVVSTSWLQAHGHAQVFGWIGSFILGIGFYSLSHQSASKALRTGAAWTTWIIWTVGVSLRWLANVYAWNWRGLLPLSAGLELAAFVVFVAAVSQHRPSTAGRLDPWIRVVASAVIGLGVTLLVNLAICIWLALNSESPAVPHLANQRFLVIMAWGFLAPFIWGFSVRWLPVFLGLGPVRVPLLTTALIVNIIGIALSMGVSTQVATWCFVTSAVGVAVALRIFSPAVVAPKTRGIDSTFPWFVRLAYVWLILGALIGVAAARWDVSGGIWGASRHAFTVGFVSVMVFSIGQRILPAFSSAKTLWSPRLMTWALTLLVIGCGLRVSSEILAYQHYAAWAWSILPISAIVEMTAFTGFAINILVTVHRA